MHPLEPNLSSTFFKFLHGTLIQGASNWSICSLLSQSCPQLLSNYWMSFNHFSPWGIQTDIFSACLAIFFPQFFFQTSECNFEILVIGAFKLIHLHPLETVLFSIFFKLLNVIQAFSPWGIQTDPFAPYWDCFVLNFFQTSECHSGILVLGAFKLIHIQTLMHIFVFNFFQTFECHFEILVLGTFKLIHLQSLETVFSELFSNFWMSFRHFSLWGIQTDPFTDS